MIKQIGSGKLSEGELATIPPFYNNASGGSRTSRLFDVNVDKLPRITEIIGGTVVADGSGVISQTITFKNLIHKVAPLVVGIFVDPFTGYGFKINGSTTLGIGLITTVSVELKSQFTAVANGQYVYKLRVYNLDLL